MYRPYYIASTRGVHIIKLMYQGCQILNLIRTRGVYITNLINHTFCLPPLSLVFFFPEVIFFIEGMRAQVNFLPFFGGGGLTEF